MNRTAEGWSVPVKLKPGKYIYKFIVDENWIVDPANAKTENDGEGINNSVFFVTNKIFKLEGFTNAKKVFVAGSFSRWEDGKIRMNKTASGWEIPVFLDTGTYTYRFLADNKWMEDPANNKKLPNEFGEFNSVISVGDPVLFMLEGLKNAQQVFLAGSFNDWRKFELSMTKTARGWEIPYVLGKGNYEYKFYADNKWLDAEGNVIKENAPGSVFVIDPNYTFHLKNRAAAKTVFLAGDFNGWSPNAYAMKKKGDDWIMPIHLSPGKHLYKFVVDGNWIIDPGNTLWEENEHGTGNSIVWVK
jgi:1,4-alpha-glucan branching enzyme